MPSFRRSRRAALSKETIFEVLRNERRRYAFHYLQQRDGPVALSEMSETIAAWEHDVDPDELTPTERNRVYVSLVQSHLPMMARNDIVSFDKEANQVELTDAASELELYLEVVDKEDIPWPEFFLGVTGLGLGFLMLVWLDIQPFALFAEYIWGIMIAILAVSAVVYHRYLGRRRLGADGSPPNGW